MPVKKVNAIKDLESQNNNQSILKQEFDLMIKQMSIEVVKSSLNGPLTDELKIISDKIEYVSKMQNETVRIQQNTIKEMRKTQNVLVIIVIAIVVLFFISSF